MIGSVLLSDPAFAPTNQIKILGATDREQAELDNLVSYELSNENTTGIKAASYLVLDYEQNQIIAGKQIDNSLPVASLTKLMTVWTALEHSQSAEVVTVEAGDIVNVSPVLGLQPGDKIRVKDLVSAVLIGSANDAASVLGGFVAKKVELPFGELMNQEAIELGMKNSRFSNPMGFDSVVNYSSARDLSILVHKLDERGMFTDSEKATEYRFVSELGNQYAISATNRLANQYPDLRAVKTGYTNLALGAMINFLDTERGRKLLVVIGSPDREGDTLELRKQFLNR